VPDRYPSILLFGPPGVGKGTQGKILGMIPGFFHLATGDMFRSLDKESELGVAFQRYSSQGLLVPDELTVRLWQQHVAQLVSRGLYNAGRDVLLLDGIPRSVAQAEAMHDYIDVLLVVHMIAGDLDEMVRRMQKRASEQGRTDDADDTVIRRRFEVYELETAPVLGAYEASLIASVDGLGTPAEVLLRILQAIVPSVAKSGAKPTA
jgi:adenylate kinase